MNAKWIGIATATLFAMLSCSAHYGVRARVELRSRDPQAQIPRGLGYEETRRIQEIVGGIAQESKLVPVASNDDGSEDVAIKELYVTPGIGPGLTMGLWIPSDRSFAVIDVDDWSNPGRKSERLVRIENELRNLLDSGLPECSVQTTDRSLGPWAP